MNSKNMQSQSNTTSRTIIAATDFSETARNAIVYAAGIAKASGSKLLLFNSFSLGVHAANSRLSPEYVQAQIDKTVLRLSNVASGISSSFGIEATVFCNYSFLEDQLNHLIQETNAELVVMGMGEKSLEQDLLGNSTTGVIKNLNIPVLAVPKEARFINLKRILFAFDRFSELPVKRLIWLRETARLVGAEMEIFSVDERIKSMDSLPDLLKSHETIDDEFKQIKYIYKSVRSNSVVEEIAKEISLYQANLLVMIPQRHGFWESLVHRSKTRLMASGLSIPLLSLPNY